MSHKTQKFLYFILFTGLALIALQIPLSRLLGADTRFTVFDVFGPAAAGLLGPVLGVAAVALAELAHLTVHGFQNLDWIHVMRLLPPLAAAWYFASKDKVVLLIPIAAITAFVIDPVGRSVWYYSLFWIIPVACYFYRQQSLLARSLGAAFTAHALGGALWIYTFNLPREMWISLIPTVIFERLVFAVGMASLFWVMSNVWQALGQTEPAVAASPPASQAQAAK